MKISDKKSAIGSTLTMILAVFFILFILIMYFVFLGISYAGKDKTEEQRSLGFSDSKLAMTKSLIGYLDSLTSDGMRVSEAIKFWADNTKDEENIKKLEAVASTAFKGNECYALSIVSNTETLSPYAEGFHSETSVLGFLASRGIIFYLRSEQNKLITINYYSGACK